MWPEIEFTTGTKSKPIHLIARTHRYRDPALPKEIFHGWIQQEQRPKKAIHQNIVIMAAITTQHNKRKESKRNKRVYP